MQNYAETYKYFLFWSVYNSLEFIDTISDIKTAHSIKTFDFSTLYTNLPLDVINGSLKSLIIKMFANSKSIANFG